MYTKEEEFIMAVAIEELWETMHARKASHVRIESVVNLYNKVTRTMIRIDIDDASEKWGTKHLTHTHDFTCGWCKRRIVTTKMEEHIKACRVTIEDVEKDLSSWLEEM